MDFGFWILDFGLPTKSKAYGVRAFVVAGNPKSKIQNPKSKIPSVAPGSGEGGFGLGHVIGAEAPPDEERRLALAHGPGLVTQRAEKLSVLEVDLGLLGLEAGARADPERFLELGPRIGSCCIG